jgi:MFS family permease
MVCMSVLRTLGHTAAVTVRVSRRATARGVRSGRFVARQVGSARRRGAAGEAGMMRLLDLHAASCAGDTLVAIGLAGTIFFAVPVGEARGRVALYLLITMLPFALLAPVVGPVLDHFRHGRRYALALTMLGRAFLAYMISEHVGGFTLYPAAFGILALSRAYGVARSAAVPRVLPEGLGLSEAGARASVFGTFAGAVVAPLGVLAYAIGPAWPLRLSMVVFVIGMVLALRLPPRADSQPPEVVPRAFQLPGHKGAKVLSGRLVLAALLGSATLRALYGFLTLFLAFSIRSGHLPTRLLPDWKLTPATALGVVAGALGLGSFLATAIGTKLHIKRPTLLQAAVILAVAVAAALAALRYSLPFVVGLCLLAAIASGLAKLAVDATIQDRVDEQVRASAFAHAETLLMLAWVVGAGLGLIPFNGRLGLALAAVAMAFGAARALPAALRLRRDRLGQPPVEPTRAEQPGRTRPLRKPRTNSWRRRRVPAEPVAATTRVLADRTQPVPVSPAPGPAEPPGYHLYRPSSTRRLDDDA